MPNSALVKKENAYAELPRIVQRLLAGQSVEA
jgi:exonuclease VII small subunit